MKSKNLVFSFVFAAFLTSSIPSGSHTLEIGSEAPSLTLSANADKNLKPLEGEQILVNFWSASDPSSRIANRTLSQLADSENHKSTRFVSVCIDSDESIASEIVKIDRISDKVVSLDKDDVTSDVLEDFQTNTGCRSFLIDRFGNLKAIATSPTQIPEILS